VLSGRKQGLTGLRGRARVWVALADRRRQVGDLGSFFSLPRDVDLAADLDRRGTVAYNLDTYTRRT
jgi:hypothetical protein